MLKNILKRSTYIVALVAVATMVSGCSLKSTPAVSTPKVFTIWSFEDEDVWKPTVANIGKDLKGYDVKYVKKTLSDIYEDEALNSILSGQGPDIWAMPNDWVYRHKDKLAPMPDSLVTSSKINLDEQYVPAIKQSVYFDNKIYGLSPAIDTLVVYYNQKLFDAALTEFSDANQIGKGDSDAVKATKKSSLQQTSKLLSGVPTLWSDFVETSKLITKKNGSNIERSGAAIGTTNNLNSPQELLYALILQNGAQMISPDLKLANFQLPQDTASGKNDFPAKRALEFYTAFANPASANYSWNSSMPNDVDAFVQGKVAMIFSFDSLYNYMAQKYPDFKFKKAALPQINTDKDTISDFGSFTTFAVPKASTNIDKAWSYISSLAKDNSFASTARLASSVKQRDFTPVLANRQGSTNPSSFQSQTAKTWVKGRYPGNVDAIFNDAINGVVAGQFTAQAALDSAAVKVTDLLKKEGW